MKKTIRVSEEKNLTGVFLEDERSSFTVCSRRLCVSAFIGSESVVCTSGSSILNARKALRAFLLASVQRETKLFEMHFKKPTNYTEM